MMRNVLEKSRIGGEILHTNTHTEQQQSEVGHPLARSTTPINTAGSFIRSREDENENRVSVVVVVFKNTSMTDDDTKKRETRKGY